MLLFALLIAFGYILLSFFAKCKYDPESVKKDGISKTLDKIIDGAKSGI